MPLAEGRDFDARDDASGAPVLIVNQAFEQRYYAGRSAMGRRIRLDAAILVVQPMTLVTYIEGPLFGQRVAALLLTMLGALALMLAATGLYSVMAYAVTQRTHEIGIRMALGAEPFNVLAMIVRRGMLLAFGGVLTGVVVALVTRKVVAGMLTGISPADPGIMAGATMFLCLVALAASFLPARRATQVDPIRALREE